MVANQNPQDADLEFLSRAFTYLEDQSTADELATLHAEMKTDAGQRKAFVRLALTHAGLIEELRRRARVKTQADETDRARPSLSDTMVLPALRLRESSNPSEQPLEPPALLSTPLPAKSTWTQPVIRAAAVIACLGIGGLIWSLLHRPSNVSYPTEQPVATTTLLPSTDPAGAVAQKPAGPPAKVGVALNAKFDADLTPDSVLPPGSHILEEGLLQLNLSNGAVLVIEAPARFEVLSESRVTLTSGRITAVVPHTHAELSIETPDLKAVDLGTEFGLDVTPEVRTHLEVFRGRVRAETSVDTAGVFQSKIVGADQSIQVKAGTTTIEDDATTPLVFVRSDELSSRTNRDGNVGMQRWQAFSNELRLDPALIAYYTFENQTDAPTQLINHAKATAGKHTASLGIPGQPDSIPSWTPGRWAGKGSLQFGASNNTVVTIPADASLTPVDEISIAIWLRRSEFTRAVHLIQEADNATNCFNVTITGTAGKRASSLAPQSIYFNYGASDEVGSSRILPTDDRWFFVAITRAADGTVHFYVDGKLTSQSNLAIPRLARNGDLWIGRSNPAAIGTDSRDIFHGQIDELAIFHRELSPEEINRFFDAGKP